MTGREERERREVAMAERRGATGRAERETVAGEQGEWELERIGAKRTGASCDVGTGRGQKAAHGRARGEHGQGEAAGGRGEE